MRLSSTLLLLTALLLLTFIVYLAGLDSRFIFDDVYNLQGLGDIENNGLLYYVFGSGFAGPGGRPIALLSFAMQYTDWPSNPFAFKLVNLSLHLVNGVLLFIFSIRLTRQLGLVNQPERLFAFLVVGLWLLHPIHVNTVLYTVQRMTQISAFFCLLGIIGYLHGRSLIETDKIRTGLTWIVFAVYGCTVLAILGKENGILLPVYLLCIETIIFSGRHVPGSIRTVLWTILSLPIFLFIAWFVLDYESIRSGFGIREFTPTERVLTESTVVVNYIKTILFPHPSAFTLFHDGYTVSHSVLLPSFTLVAIVIIVIMLITCVIVRKKYPIVTLGILLFFSGHLLEAGPVSLELYFEHRNYLPSIGISLVLAWIITAGLGVNRHSKAVGALAGLYLICLTAITIEEVQLWSDPEVQLAEWVYSKPASDRAKQELAMLYTTQGKYNEAEKIYEQLLQKHGDDMNPVIHLLQIMTCRQHKPLSEQELERILQKAATPLRFNLASIAALDFLVLDVIKNECPALNIDYLEDMLMTLTGNPASRMDPAILYEFLSSIAINRGNLVQAVDYLRQSLVFKFDVDRKVREIALLDRLDLGDERESAVMELKNYLSDNPRAYLAYNYIVNKQQ